MSSHLSQERELVDTVNNDIAAVPEGSSRDMIKLEQRASAATTEDPDEEDNQELHEEDNLELLPSRRPWVEKLITCFWFGVNIISTVAIVFLNKLVYLDAQLKDFQIATAVYHFSVTFLILFAVSAGLPRNARVFEPIYIPVSRMFSVSVFFSAAVVLGNVRLAYCSIGFFQLTKILLTPCTALLNYILFRRTTSRVRLLAIGACCIGTAMTNTKEAVANPLATLIAFASIVVAATYQIWIGKRMGDLKVSAPQLLLNQAPLSVVILLCFLPFYSSRPKFDEIQTKSLLAFLASGIAAAGVNLSQFLIIGRTSPLTFTIVGVVKTIVVVLLAPLFDASSFTAIQVSGIMLVTYGVWTYARNGDGAASRTQLSIALQARETGVLGDEEKAMLPTKPS